MLGNRLKSRAVQGLVRVGPRLLELRRFAPGRGGATLFCDPLDAHSWLLAAELWRQRRWLPEAFTFHWIGPPERALDPEPALRVRHASRDVRLLLEIFDFAALLAPRELLPDVALRVAARTLDCPTSLQRLEAAAAALPEVFAGTLPPEGDYSTAGSRLRVEMNIGGVRERQLGHYQGAMLYDRGAWYWGVDRLPLWLAKVSGEPLSSCEAQVFRPRGTLGFSTSEHPRELDVYFSFRSPYSYLALRRASELAATHGLALRLRPVLPMVMRGLAVPPRKKFYLLFDAAREAQRVGIPFGRISDPVGPGAERCLAAFCAAEGAQRGAFAQRAMTAIWSEGVDVASDAGLRAVCSAVDLAWTRVQAAMLDEAWRSVAEHNREELTALGLWGVPSFRFGGHALWGQDRLRVLEQLLPIA